MALTLKREMVYFSKIFQTSQKKIRSQKIEDTKSKMTFEKLRILC